MTKNAQLYFIYSGILAVGSSQYTWDVSNEMLLAEDLRATCEGPRDSNYELELTQFKTL